MRRVDVRGVESWACVCALVADCSVLGSLYLGGGGHILVFFGPVSASQRSGLKEGRVQDGCVIRISNSPRGHMD